MRLTRALMAACELAKCCSGGVNDPEAEAGEGHAQPQIVVETEPQRLVQPTDPLPGASPEERRRLRQEVGRADELLEVERPGRHLIQVSAVRGGDLSGKAFPSATAPASSATSVTPQRRWPSFRPARGGT